jgi:FlaA1/EpsC-like NDP-sugar epimerase
MEMSYARFGAIVATATVIMYALMYLNTYEFDHVHFSETRAYMALIMGATMGIVMLVFMLKMYKNKKANIGIITGSVALFALSLWLVRSQATVGEVSYMRAMIPHHSIAIMTSERAHITDPRVRQLADEIIRAQREEIAEMEMLIRDLTDGAAAPQ